MAELLGPILECMKALWMLDDFYSILDPDRELLMGCFNVNTCVSDLVIATRADI